jgi:hypothetical protein
MHYIVPGLAGVDPGMRFITIARLLSDQGTNFGRLDVGGRRGPAGCRHPTTRKTNIEIRAWRTSFTVSSKEPYELNLAGDVEFAILDFGAEKRA